MTDFRAYQEDLLKQMAETMGMSYEQLTGRWNPGRRYGRTYAQDQAQRTANMKEINPRPQASTKPPRGEDVVIEHSDEHMAYWVSLPRAGRMGDRRLYDGETGKPVNIGPTYRGRGEFNTIPEALAHFKRVADAFERLL